MRSVGVARAARGAIPGALVCGLAALIVADGPTSCAPAHARTQVQAQVRTPEPAREPMPMPMPMPSPTPAREALPVDALARAFAAPPDDSRIMMRWWWFGPAVTRPQIARDLRAMQAAGIGGVELQPVYPVALDDDARGIRNLAFLSEAFIDAVRFASSTARELGLRFDLTLGSGWPYGGPQVPIAQAAGRLRVVRLPVPAGARQVALPDIGPGEAMIAAFLVDLPHPADAAPRALTAIGDGLIRLPPDDAVRTGSGDGARGPAARDREVQVFIASRTGMMVKRPALGAEGFVLDHYDRRAIDGYLATVGDRLMQAFADAPPPYAIFTDSLELFGSDWTPDLLAQFQQRRGYDLRPLLPSLVADDDAASAGLRHDWGLTLTELLNERFLAPMQAWAHRHGTKFRVQGYGMPPAALSSNAHADLSDGEGTEWRLLSTSRWASSANHLHGRPVTASETWTWLHSPSFRATPLDMKAEADIHFLQGINQLIGHGWPSAAEGAEYPGWRFYAAGAFNEKNPWWIVMPDLARYLQRVSFLLRQGQPANDVALYLPTADAYASFTPGSVHLVDILKKRLGADILPAILDAGFNLDFVDDESLRRAGKVEGGTLTLGGNRYRAVILPGVERMPLDTLRTLDAFARGGGTVIATRRRPSRAPGFRATAAEHAEVARLASGLFGETRPVSARAAAPAGAFAEDERADLAKALHARLQPDVTLTPAAPDVGIVHRRTPDADIYFVANTSNQPRRVAAAFRVQGRPAELWDAMTGRVSAIAIEKAARGSTSSATTGTSDTTGISDTTGTRETRGTTTVRLELPPYGSTIVLFSSRRSSPPSRAPAAVTEAAASAAAAAPATSASAASAATRDGRGDAATAVDISDGWQVTFTSASDGRAFVQTMDRLRPWTDDPATRDFSGTAVYERRVDVPAALLGAGRPVRLDFGEARAIAPEANARFRTWLDAPVREAVVVEVNGRRVGSVWSPPYALDVTRWLTPGANQLRLIVGNLAINHMAARARPDYRLLNLRHGVRFEPQDMKDLRPLPAGLLGPIALRAGG